MKTAVFMGRFQPLHNGHVQALKEISRKFDKIIIVIGTPKNKRDIDSRNPLTTNERILLLKKALKELNIHARIIIQRDVGIEKVWKRELLQKIPKKSVIVSGNQDVLNFLGKSHQTISIKKKIPINATMIRKWIRSDSGKWKKFVPKKTIPLLMKWKTRERLHG